MNILLATYNFYPFNWGGSEVYLDGLTKHLIATNNTVKLIAAVPNSAFEQHRTFWTGNYLRICFYEYQDLEVYGVQHSVNTLEIYSKYNQEWQKEWGAFLEFLNKTTNWSPDLLHLHGFTAIIGLALIKAFQDKYKELPIHATYHTPISCPKGTLLHWEQTECNISANVKDCTACAWNAKTHWPAWSSSLVSALLPIHTSSFLPTALKWKTLVSSAVQSFQDLASIVDHWWVFSDQIRQVLLAQGLDPQRITMGRHAAAPIFHQRSSTPTRAADDCIFAFVGRFTAIKGLGTLLQAWQQLPIQANRELWLIGDNNDADPEINTLLAQLAQRPDIQLLGKKSPEALAELYTQIHALIVPSEWVEIGPLVVHEALACGANVLGSAIGGIRELSTYYPAGAVQLFPSGDVQALASLLSNYQYQALPCVVATEAEHYQKVQSWYLDQA